MITGFTGEHPLYRGMGRTDLPAAPMLNHELHRHAVSASDDPRIWPGHNYGRFPVSTVREQKTILYLTPERSSCDNNTHPSLSLAVVLPPA